MKAQPMTDDEFFEAQFPGTVLSLQILRARNEEFDRVCREYREYRELFSELTQQSETGAEVKTRYLADLAECLSDLRSTIEGELRQSFPDGHRSVDLSEGRGLP